MIKIVIPLLILLILSQGKLYQVVSLFRHGARYHLNSLYDGNSTRDRWGQLTPVGMRQHQNLGKTLRKQYIDKLNFLNPNLKPEEIQVYSTNINRTIDSAQSQLYGLWPAGTGPSLIYTAKKYHLPPFSNKTDLQQQNFAFPNGHQHVLVNTDSQSILLQTCPNFDKLVQANVQLASIDINEMNMTYYPFIKKVFSLFNLTLTANSSSTFSTLNSLFDTLVVDKYMGRPLPSNFSEDDYKNLEHLHNWFFTLKYSGDVAKLANTYKFNKIIAQFDARIKNPDTYGRKWTFLSAHDTDISPAKSSLNFSSYQCIEELYRKGNTTALNCQPDFGFASSIIFQLHSDNGKSFYVKIRSLGKYMNLCQQKSTQCDYTTFKNRLKQYILTDVPKRCGLTANTPKQISPFRLYEASWMGI